MPKPSWPAEDDAALEAAGAIAGPDAEALGELAGGSVGEALRLSERIGRRPEQTRARLQVARRGGPVMPPYSPSWARRPAGSPTFFCAPAPSLLTTSPLRTVRSNQTPLPLQMASNGERASEGRASGGGAPSHRCGTSTP